MCASGTYVDQCITSAVLVSHQCSTTSLTRIHPNPILRRPSGTDISSLRTWRRCPATPLVELLRAHNSAGPQLVPKECLKQTAANVLMQLAVDDDNKQAVREAGGLRKLVSLLSSPDPEVQLHVLGALTNLALDHENKARSQIPMCSILTAHCSPPMAHRRRLTARTSSPTILPPLLAVC